MTVTQVVVVDCVTAIERVNVKNMLFLYNNDTLHKYAVTKEETYE